MSLDWRRILKQPYWCQIQGDKRGKKGGKLWATCSCSGYHSRPFWQGQQVCVTDPVTDDTPHHKSPLDEINEIRRNAADSLWVLKVTRRRILPLTAII